MLELSTLDWCIIAAFVCVLMGIGLWAARTAGKSSTEFFLAGRGMPWWLLGVSMVACTFSADTPNLVCDMVRDRGVSQNWAWWAFLITGMVTVFIYAKLWRRSEVMTDLEFYELRYGGRPAAFLRGFRAIYLGLFFNVLIMASVTLALIKYGSLLFGVEKWECVLYGSIGVVAYAALGGIKGCLWADLFQYSVAMFGAVCTAVVAVTEAGKASAKKALEAGEIASADLERYTSEYGLSNLLEESNVADKLSLFPDFSDPAQLIPLLILPLAVQWWAAWYPGAEPGGGGYVAQRMLAAKDEINAVGATLFFNFAHYALRPWPWIIAALASLVCYPEIADLSQAFPHVDGSIIGHDIAYPAMVSKLDSGLRGIVIASIGAAYMSTIGTHLNWGASYVINDFYHRFIHPTASEKELVRMARICTVLLMVAAGLLSMQLSNAKQAFDIMLLAGAGSGAIYLLRWFWWRINAWSEISAMIVTTAVASVLVLCVDVESLKVGDIDGGAMRFLLAVIATTIAWLLGTFLTQPEKTETLRNFYRKCHPGGPGWEKVIREAREAGQPVDEGEQQMAWQMPQQVLCVFLGCVAIYGSLFAIGSLLYGNLFQAGTLLVFITAATIYLFRQLAKLNTA